MSGAVSGLCLIVVVVEREGSGWERRWRGKGHTIIIVITNHHFLNLPILAHLAPEILVEGIEMILELRRVHLVLGVVGWVLVEIG